MEFYCKIGVDFFTTNYPYSNDARVYLILAGAQTNFKLCISNIVHLLLLLFIERYFYFFWIAGSYYEHFAFLLSFIILTTRAKYLHEIEGKHVTWRKSKRVHTQFYVYVCVCCCFCFSFRLASALESNKDCVTIFLRWVFACSITTTTTATQFNKTGMNVKNSSSFFSTSCND